RKGDEKIQNSCSLAFNDGYEFIWFDANYIDKSNSSELWEAINFMFAWYRMADVCYVYLSDVYNDINTRLRLDRADILESRWFTRGWTLQELLAPRRVKFYFADWSLMGNRASLNRIISKATGVSQEFLLSHSRAVHEASVAERMSWLARRTTAKIEDLAYCALGIFDVNVPLIYGEGRKAFFRLQQEIIKASDDYSIFCWTYEDEGGDDHADGLDHGSIFASSPAAFLDSTGFKQLPTYKQRAWGVVENRLTPFVLTNAGLSMQIPLLQSWSTF
ncbi:hypothetical protein B0H63DRAFT_375016, partial [Podospora didyma]